MLRPALLHLAFLLPAAAFAQAPAGPPASSNSALSHTAAPTPAAADTTTLREVGGNVLPPKLTYQVDPKYPRPLFGRPKASRVLVGLVITPAGVPTNLHVIRSGGAAFDKSALECVAQYRFSPATENGLPVPVKVNVDVNFQIFAGNTPPPGYPTP